MITFVNIALVVVNFYCIGLSQQKMQVINDKLDDMAMIEERIKHISENLDSCFR